MQYDEREVGIDSIDEPVSAMRTEIGRDAVFELADDIRRNGLINPITVRPRGERFEVVAGHRRFLAHRYGGIASIRCIVRDLTDDEAFAIMTSENLAREDVNPVDEAIHTKRLFDRSGGDLTKTVDVLNRSREWVVSRLTVADMPDDLKTSLREGKIKLGVALALNEITDDTDRLGCIQMAIAQGASVVVAKYWVAQWHAGLFGHATQTALPDPDAPGRERTVVMLRCAVDGKEYPASDFASILVRRENVGYIDAIRKHLQETASAAPGAPASIGPVPGIE